VPTDSHCLPVVQLIPILILAPSKNIPCAGHLNARRQQTNTTIVKNVLMIRHDNRCTKTSPHPWRYERNSAFPPISLLLEHCALCTARNRRSIGRSIPLRNGLRLAGRRYRAVRAGREAPVPPVGLRALGESEPGSQCLGESTPVARRRLAGTGGMGRRLPDVADSGNMKRPMDLVSNCISIRYNV
jgi:hypothetical protein